MKAIRGEYHQGKITLLEQPPLAKSNKVLVMFLDEDENEDEVIRTMSLQQPSNSFTEYLKDEREDIYQEYLKG